MRYFKSFHLLCHSRVLRSSQRFITAFEPQLNICESRVLLAVNPIVTENQLPGTPETQWSVGTGADTSLQGFATDISVNHGQSISFKINDSARVAYHIDIYRMGYYQGNGARLVTNISSSQVLQQIQPNALTDPVTGLSDAGNWSVSASWVVPSTATSGIYFARLIRNDTGGASLVYFVVRADDSHSNLLFQTSDTTWEAYNTWGGSSLYQGSCALLPDRAVKVSYNRPLTIDASSGGYGDYNSPLHAEYPMVRWLEMNGYDITYFTNVDTARNGGLILNHSAMLSVGHDEYWSSEQRASVQSALAGGVNLAFFSGNECFWKTRWEASIDGSGQTYRTLVCYKDSKNPSPLDPQYLNSWTGTWRDIAYSPPSNGGNPENALSGTMYMNDRTSIDLGISITVPSTFSSLRFWRNTAVSNLAPGQSATLGQYTLGYETDEDVDNGSRPAGLINMSSTTFSTTSHVIAQKGTVVGLGSSMHSITLYRATSGALVFGAGTVQWSWGLDGHHNDATTSPDPSIQQATINLLAEMNSQPGTIQPGMVLASASTIVTAPTSTIIAPSTGSSVVVGSTVTITGTAVAAGGGVVAGVEVSVDGGKTWHPATGRSNWSYSWIPFTTGSVSIKSRATDDSVNLEVPSTGMTLTVTGVTSNGPFSLWGGTSIPTVSASSDLNAQEVGVKFQSDVSGYVTALRFFKGAGAAGTHVGHLWSAKGSLLATATFTNETYSGWQQVSFATPVAIIANTIYVASYYAPNGGTSVDSTYFASTGRDSVPLHALSNTTSGGNGVYSYGALGVFPNSSFNASNYWVDVVLSTSTSFPTVTATTPINGATGVSISSPSISATFSTLLNPSSILFTLKDPAGNTIPTGAVEYNATTSVATIVPLSALASSTTYTATIIASDSSGNAMPSAYSWSFSTQFSGTGPFSLWDSSVSPANASSTDTSACEVGVKFQSDVPGNITGIRFYKGTSNTGTHVGHLWSASGTLLAVATFTGESASGWQQVSFAAPVSIVANIIYVASYYAPVGRYAYNESFFATTGVDNAPLHAPSNAIVGGNGVYSYGSLGVFPTSTYNSNNYWIDVVLTSSSSVVNPTVTGESPVLNSTNVPISISPTVTFNESVLASSIGFTLKTSSGVSVPATVSYNVTTFTATLTPTTPLVASTVYTATVSSATDGSGNVMASPFSWSFTTASPLIPNVTVNTPTSNATSVLSSVSPTVIFNESVLASSIGFTLKTSSGVSVPATVTYNVTTFTATLTPTSPLVASTVYTATVSDATDGSGNSMAPPFSWSFTTASANTGPFSIWASSVTPKVVSSSDHRAQELGIKFQSDLSGYIAGVRFYKGAGNTGTHVGHLWSSTGVLLATATFSAETTSGWQQVHFTTPIAIAANTVYVVSYYAPVGSFSYSTSYFSKAGIDTAPLHALSNTAAGGNGVFTRGKLGSFPSSSNNATNYWVDLVFSTVTVGSLAKVYSPPSTLTTRFSLSPSYQEVVSSGTSISLSSTRLSIPVPARASLQSFTSSCILSPLAIPIAVMGKRLVPTGPVASWGPRYISSVL